jgi:glutamate N-acetyltransferase/amino-acid N-acetyltransferase
MAKVKSKLKKSWKTEPERTATARKGRRLPKNNKYKKNARAHAVSPLASAFPELPPVPGMSLGVGRTGIRYRDRDDLFVASFDAGTTVAGVFTQSKMPSAPVDWCRNQLADGEARLLVANAGNANAFTGRAGWEAVRWVASSAAGFAKCRQKDVYIASTGVIGVPLPADRLTAELGKVFRRLGTAGFEAAARAMMTTDTFPKGVTRTAYIDGRAVVINGIAKGSGMIAPDLATMLAFIFTNAAIPADVLQTLLILGVRESFNNISVDGDTSTSDTVLLFATGRSSTEGEPVHDPIRRADGRLKDFRDKLFEVMADLARQIVCDGEGARKFITVHVDGAASQKAARNIALAIANSPLVKTAAAGSDPNWGRIVAAVGKSGEAADRDRLAIWIGDVQVATEGMVHPDYDEALAAKHMKGNEIHYRIDVGVGRASAQVWTCDLTENYIRINTDYRS